MKASWLPASLLVACAALAAAGDGSAAKLLEGKGPEYPAAEKNAGHGGTVVLTFRVGKAGVIEDLQVKTSSGHPGLDAAALDAARQWKFAPATDADGTVIDANFEQRFEFQAPEDPMGFLVQSCAKLVAEVAALRAARPEARLADAKTFAKTGGMLILAASSRATGDKMAMLGKLSAYYEAVYADCQQTPESVYEQAMKRHFDVLGMEPKDRARAK